MKKTIASALIISIIFGMACGNSSNENTTQHGQAAAPGKKAVLETEDAMMARLAEYKITIPEGMIFRSVDKQAYLNKDFEETDTYLVYFDTREPKKEELLSWFTNQRAVLTGDGWTEKTFEKDLEILGGGSYDRSVFVKESENCTLDMRVSYTDEGSTISIHPKYEIR